MVNKLTLVGRLGDDPVLRKTPSDVSVCNVSIATTRTWKNKEGVKQEDTQWHRVSFFNKLADIAGQYLKKGSLVFVEGRVEYGSYEKEGVKMYSTNIVADEMKMLGSKNENAQQENNGTQNNSSNSANDNRGLDQSQTPANHSYDNFDDDIPF